MHLRVRLFLLATLPLCAAYPVSEYAKNCEKVMGVPVPPVDCEAPGGSEVPVGKIENGKCDTPSHGLSGCNPGTRFIKYTDTITRNGKSETITTMMMCRKTNEDAERGDKAKNVYSDIGVIQYNETKHAACWFSSTSDNQKPTEKLKDGRLVYPSPSRETAPGFWGSNQPESKCISCHQNGVWMRNPFAMGVKAEKGKGYVGKGNGDYQPGVGNHIPDNHEETHQRGLPCSVGISEWNTPNGETAPLSTKIDNHAYNVRFPNKPESAVAAPDTCTQCHYIGVGAGTMICDKMVNDFRGVPHSLRRTGAPLAKHFWMPPGEEFNSEKEYLAYYAKALEAVNWCCDKKNHAETDFSKICMGKFEGSGKEKAALDSLNSRGPCALCPDCTASTPHRYPKRSRNHSE